MQKKWVMVFEGTFDGGKLENPEKTTNLRKSLTNFII
jgi:hypothetical protein